MSPMPPIAEIIALPETDPPPPEAPLGDFRLRSGPSEAHLRELLATEQSERQDSLKHIRTYLAQLRGKGQAS